MRKKLCTIVIIIGLTLIASCTLTKPLSYGINCEVHDVDLKNNTITLKQKVISIYGKPTYKTISYELIQKELIPAISKNQKVIVYFYHESTYNHKILAIIPDKQ
jgi:hypothetical protein